MTASDCVGDARIKIEKEMEDKKLKKTALIVP